jgi:hypothetical protein
MLNNPITGLENPLGLKGLRVPELLDIKHLRWQGCKPNTPTALTPQEIPMVIISVRDKVDRRAIVKPEGKLSMT